MQGFPLFILIKKMLEKVFNLLEFLILGKSKNFLKGIGQKHFVLFLDGLHKEASTIKQMIFTKNIWFLCRNLKD